MLELRRLAPPDRPICRIWACPMHSLHCPTWIRTCRRLPASAIDAMHPNAGDTCPRPARDPPAGRRNRLDRFDRVIQLIAIHHSSRSSRSIDSRSSSIDSIEPTVGIPRPVTPVTGACMPATSCLRSIRALYSTMYTVYSTVSRTLLYICRQLHVPVRYCL